MESGVPQILGNLMKQTPPGTGALAAHAGTARAPWRPVVPALIALAWLGAIGAAELPVLGATAVAQVGDEDVSLPSDRASEDTLDAGGLDFEETDSLGVAGEDFDDFEGFSDFGGSDWDSIMAAYDEAFEEQRRERITPEYGIRYSKAEGLHVDGGVSLTYAPLRLARAEARAGYDFKREKANGFGSVDFDLGSSEAWLVRVQGHDGIRPFGNHDLYGNTLLALFGGYDARQYLRSRQGELSLVWRPVPNREYSFGWLRAQQDPVRAVSPFHIFGRDFWMRRNTRAEKIVVNGLSLQARSRPEFLGDSKLFGLGYAMDVRTFGGEFLGGSREFGTGHLDVSFSGRVGRTDSWLVRCSGSIATGRAPLQALPDLGGAAGLRAFPPRGEGTELNLVGPQRLYATLEYHWEQDLLRRTRLPILRDMHLIPVPFIETGAVWGPGHRSAAGARPILDTDDIQAPARQDFHWDLGLGVRRFLNYSGILSHVQVDVAWPMGHDTGPPRFTASFTRSDFD